MSTEANKALLQRFYDEVLNQGKLDAIDELIAENVIEHEQFGPGMPEGRAAARQIIAMFRSAFPDLHATLDDAVAEDDKVAVRGTWRGTHQGEFMGIPPTRRSIEIGVMDIVRCADGKMIEHWGQTDAMTLMQQLGVIPAPESAGA